MHVSVEFTIGQLLLSWGYLAVFKGNSEITTNNLGKLTHYFKKKAI